MKSKSTDIQRLTLPIVGFVWILGIVVGSYFMFQHEFTPGKSAPAPEKLPAAFSEMAPQEDQLLTLFMAVHPDCPCTGASIEQLDRFLTKHPGEARAVALFWTPEADSESNKSLEGNSYWNRLRKLNSVSTVVDPRGELAEKLGSLVSGAVVAYDNEANLTFQGGLTATRGHEGPSVGLAALTAFVSGKSKPELCRTPSFGCSLNEES